MTLTHAQKSIPAYALFGLPYIHVVHKVSDLILSTGTSMRFQSIFCSDQSKLYGY